MKLLNKIRKEIKVIFILLLAITGIAFVEKRQRNMVCNAIQIQILNPEGSEFIDENDVRKLITGDESVFLIGTPYRRLNLKEIENRAMINLYIQDAQAYKDHKGNVLVDVYVARPLARLLKKGSDDIYISEKGNLINVSEKYTSRVLLVSGNYVNKINGNLRQDPYQRQLFDFINHINQDPFWKAQIAQIDISASGEMTLYPQVTRQYIEFGRVDNWESKLLKLKIFYNKILPQKGWNNYTRVNLKYENQIICE